MNEKELEKEKMGEEMPKHILSKERTRAKNEKEYAPKRFDQTFFKSLMRGANPCGGNSALELIPSGERDVFARRNIKN